MRVVIPAALLIGMALAWAGSQGGSMYRGVPVFAIVVAGAFAIQWVAFLPAFLFRTERFFDLTGSLTYLTLLLGAVVLSGGTDSRGILLAGMVGAWAIRLGTFLFLRILKTGTDGRFDEIRGSAGRFLGTWTLQGLWVALTAGAALAALTTDAFRPLGALAGLGVTIWATGFAFQVVADEQKRRFRTDPQNDGRFIENGLWSLCRHPNYLGEIVLWTGVALVAAPALRGWQLATLISPVFVYVLLTRVSGVPLLQERADQKWGGDPDYEAYKAQVPVLVPRLRRPR